MSEAGADGPESNVIHPDTQPYERTPDATTAMARLVNPERWSEGARLTVDEVAIHPDTGYRIDSTLGSNRLAIIHEGAGYVVSGDSDQWVPIGPLDVVTLPGDTSHLIHASQEGLRFMLIGASRD